MEVLGRVFPFLVEIIAADIWAVVSMDNAIGVDHGDNFEYEVLTQFFCLLVGWKEELQYTIRDIGADTLSWMNTGSDNDIAFLYFLERMFLSNGE